ncbi:glycosyltransferase family 4 protein [Desulfonauticus submarinus]
MRIVFFSSSSTSSGGTRQALYTLQELTKLGHKTAFVVPKNSTIINKCPNTNWIELPNNIQQWKNFFFNFIYNYKPSIIHAYHNKAIKKIAWWSLFFKTKKIAILAHRGVVFRPTNPLPYWSWGIDCFTANSQACAQKIHQIGVPRQKIEVVYNCLPPNRTLPTIDKKSILQQLHINPQEVIIGTISGNSPIKGVNIFLRAISKLKDLSFKVLILGANKEKWIDLVQQLKIEHLVHFLGHQENVANYLQIMDIFCIPSLSESIPNTLLEAIAFNLPVVASKVGGIPEILEGKGILVSPGRSDELAQGLKKLYLDKKLRNILGEKLGSLRKNFLPQTKAKQLETLYQKLLRKKLCF